MEQRMCQHYHDKTYSYGMDKETGEIIQSPGQQGQYQHINQREKPVLRPAWNFLSRI
jgi:hypothetical protein